jgi:hypothetical protein
MSKRPPVDLTALTAGAAEPMAEASQRSVSKPAPPPPSGRHASRPESVGTANLEALAFKVPPTFRKRFRQCAVDADMKLNELLFAALDAWEEKRKK